MCLESDYPCRSAGRPFKDGRYHRYIFLNKDDHEIPVVVDGPKVGGVAAVVPPHETSLPRVHYGPGPSGYGVAPGANQGPRRMLDGDSHRGNRRRYSGGNRDDAGYLQREGVRDGSDAPLSNLRSVRRTTRARDAYARSGLFIFHTTLCCNYTLCSNLFHTRGVRGGSELNRTLGFCAPRPLPTVAGAKTKNFPYLSSFLRRGVRGEPLKK